VAIANSTSRVDLRGALRARQYGTVIAALAAMTGDDSVKYLLQTAAVMAVVMVALAAVLLYLAAAG
jgi:hypothetical protein